MHKPKCKLWFGLGVLLLATLACYRSAPPPTLPPPPPTVTPLPPDIPDVRIGGSAFVGAITTRVVEGFRAWQPHYEVVLDASGTSHGFDLMCRGEADLVNAMRPMTGEEVTACTRSGVEWLEIVVAYDVLVVVRNPQDAFLDCLALGELRAAWTAGDLWPDIRRSFPDLPVAIIGAEMHPSQDLFFAEALRIDALRADITSSQNPIKAIQETPGGLTYLGYGAYQEAERAGLVRRVAVDEGTHGCVAPEEAAVWDGMYSVLARPMYLYVNVASLQRLSMSLFVGYYLSADGQAAILETGYMPASPAHLERARAAVDAHTGG